DSHRLGPFARSDVRDALRLPPGTPAWPTAVEQWAAPADLTAAATHSRPQDPGAPVAAIPTAALGLLETIMTATAELRPTESSLKSSRTRVSASLAELQTQLSAAGHDYRPEWVAADEIIVVKVADEQGFSSIGEFARRISD